MGKLLAQGVVPGRCIDWLYIDTAQRLRLAVGELPAVQLVDVG